VGGAFGAGGHVCGSEWGVDCVIIRAGMRGMSVVSVVSVVNVVSVVTLERAERSERGVLREVAEDSEG
jgi:hypothetical protein